MGALGLILLSVCMHVSWNLLAKQTSSKANFIWWGLLAHCVIFLPVGFWALFTQVDWHLTLIWAQFCSASALVVYFYALAQAYRYASVATVYPIARSSPLLIAIIGQVFFAQPLSLIGWSGIILSATGLIWLSMLAEGRAQPKSLIWSIIAAMATCVYSLSDHYAVQHLPSFSAQLGYITVGYLASFVMFSLVNKYQHQQIRPLERPKLILIIIGGICIGLAYALVVRAMASMPAAYAVMLSNLGIVIATGLSLLLEKKRSHIWQHISSSLVITLGIMILAVAPNSI